MVRYFFGLLLLFVIAAPVQAAELIRSFSSTIEPSADGSFEVIETIEYDFGNASRHGIFRTLLKQHTEPSTSWFKKRSVEYELIAVSANDGDVPFEVTESSASTEIKIGDPDKVVSGLVTYQVRYRVNGGLTYEVGTNPELYYNVTGHEWTVPILKTTATINDTAGLLLPQRACYMGVPGVTASCTITATSSMVSFVAGEMAPGGGLTIAQALNGALVAEQKVETISYVIILLPLLALLLAAAAWFAFRFETKHRPDLPVVAQYEPFPEVLPMYTGVIIDGQLDPKDITAGLVHLAATGFLHLKRTEEKVLFFFESYDYELTLLKPLSDAVSAFDTTILEMLFGPGATVTNTPVRLKDIKSDYNTLKRNQEAMTMLKRSIADDLVERGFYEKVITSREGWGAVCIIIVALGLAVLTLPLFPALVPGPIIFALLFTACVAGVLLASMYRRRTALGYAAKNHLEGFKEFLSVTDRERFAFHNAPKKNPEQFMEYLPYAIALGVEEEWAKVFKDITIPNPAWYSSADSSAFTATAFASDLGSFSSSFTSATGTSSSSGGGVSGGGSGGGGGGSW